MMHATLPSLALQVEIQPAEFEVRDRRLPGEAYPRVPVGHVELNRAQTACVLLETWADKRMGATLSDHRRSVADAVASNGVEWVLELMRDFVHLEPMTDESVARCWELAHRLTVDSWFTNAEARLMNTAEYAVCLYLAGEDRLPRRLHAQALADPTPVKELNAIVAEVAATLPADRLVWLGTQLNREVNPQVVIEGSKVTNLPLTPEEKAARREMKSVMPDYQRRLFAHRIAFGRVHFMYERSAPLIVTPATGETFYGPVVSDCPESRLHALAQLHGRERAMELAA